MLKKLTILNYALIDRIEIEFDRGLHILTGETGAGKSIILGALGLVMGNRADLKALYDPDQNCFVEAVFDTGEHSLDEFLRENDIDPSDELIIRRVISANGKSRAFINDFPVSLKTIQEVTVQLVQIHNQFDNLDLSQPDFQLKMLDALAGNGPLLTSYSECFVHWQQEKKALHKLRQEVEDFAREKDFIRFQFDELSAIDLEEARDEDIESNLELMEHAEAIQQAMQSAFYQLTDEENSVVNTLASVYRQLEQAGGQTQLVGEFASRLQDLKEQLEALGNELYEKAETIEYDPEKITELQEKLNTINKLLHKHGLKEIEALIELREELEHKLTREMEVEDLIVEKEQLIVQLEKELKQLAGRLSESRRESAERFTGEAVHRLRELAMPHVQLKGQFETLDTPGPSGSDAFELLFSANKGSKPEGIRHVASGGELSRLSLTIKSILAGHMALPTLIFDEIEAGISGEIALKMGNILKNLSRSHQIINITHSAQIASRGDHHFFVYKSDQKDKSVTNIKTLSPDERILEIAKMLSGDPPTPTAIKNAHELIHLN